MCPALQPAGITEADSRWAEPGLIGPILDLVYSGPSAALQSVRGESSKSQIVYRERAAELLRENRRATDANRTGLIVVSSFGQPLDAFFVHAKALALCFAVSTFLHNASLIVVNANSAMLRYGSADGPSERLRAYKALPLRLVMLLMTRVNFGHMCGELFELHALVRVWSLYPWVLACSGPDTLPMPHGLLAFEQRVRQRSEWVGASDDRRRQLGLRRFLLADRFPAPSKHVRYSLDLLLFFPDAARLPTCTRDTSVWSAAAALCVRDGQEMPEATIAMAMSRLNKTGWSGFSDGGGMSVSKASKTAGAASGHAAPRPGVAVWHVHNVSGAARWLESVSAAEWERLVQGVRRHRPPLSEADALVLTDRLRRVASGALSPVAFLQQEEHRQRNRTRR